MNEFIEVEILKFKTLVKRNDIKNPQWFAIEYDILEHPDFLNIDGNEFKAFVWVVGVAVKLNNPIIRVYPELFERRTGVDKKHLASSLRKLDGKRFALRDPNAHVTDALRTRSATRQDKTRQDTHKATESPSVASDCLFQLWNEHRGNLPAAKAFTQKRKKAARARFDESPNESYWVEVIKRLSKSSFCNGGGSTGWVATFDFLLRPDTHVKVSEGVYDNKGGSSMNSKIGRVSHDD